jgi:hypothetical protein
MVIRRIHRDRAVEALIFERLDEFIERLRTNTPPTMADVDPKLALAALGRIYGASRPGQTTIEFGRKHEKPLRRIAALQAENSELSEKIKKNETEATALSVKIAEMMDTHEHGVLETAADRLTVSYITKFTRRVDCDLLKKNYPIVHGAVLKSSGSRNLKVEIQAK